ncbi:MAG: sigma-70 family RNA polymerase sigma factor [Chloroflexota bacterium]
MADPLRGLSLDEIIRQCREEARRSREQEIGYCFELFRRALQGSDEVAWAAIDHQYRPLVLTWVRQRAPDQADEEDLAQESFHHFWRSLSPHAPHLGDRFAHVGHLLNYLKQCATTATLDYWRQTERQARLQRTLELAESHEIVTRLTPEGDWEQADLLGRLRAWVEAHVTDVQEKLVLSASFENGLSPADVARHYPQVFADAAEVRRVKERVLKRIGRAFNA